MPIQTRSRGYLPHWEQKNATYSLTFRLADSLPQKILNQYREERALLLKTLNANQRPLTPHERQQLHDLFTEKIEHHLDTNLGQCHLRHPDIAMMVQSALLHFHPARYTLLTWCIMPNHVHALLTPHDPHSLETILHSWKSFTSKEANKLLQRTGIFWMPEYHDHLIRDLDDLHNHHHYILNNPKKAHLKNWPWVGTTLNTPP